MHCMQFGATPSYIAGQRALSIFPALFSYNYATSLWTKNVSISHSLALHACVLSECHGLTTCVPLTSNCASASKKASPTLFDLDFLPVKRVSLARADVILANQVQLRLSGRFCLASVCHWWLCGCVKSSGRR
jgi:hypothetical protein